MPAAAQARLAKRPRVRPGAERTGRAAVRRHVSQQEELGRSVQVSRGPDCSGGHRVGATPHSPRGSGPPFSLGTQARAGCLRRAVQTREAALGAGEASGGKRPSLSFQPSLTACLSLESLRGPSGRRLRHRLRGSLSRPSGQVPFQG